MMKMESKVKVLTDGMPLIVIRQLTSAGSRLSAGFHRVFRCVSLTSLSPLH